MNDLPDTNRNARPILWITALALLLVALTGQVRVRACVGDACAGGCEVAAASCCGVPDGVVEDGDTGCCGCCDDDGEPPRDDDDDGACGTGCCITIAFDVDLAPTVVADDLPIPAMLPCGWPVAPRAPPLVREAERRSTCDGGPPRVDRRTALRATTVLLI